MVFSAIPQVITEDRASGAQFIGGSLKFDSGKSQHLKRTYNSAGNRRFWTWSAWVKRGSIPSSNIAQSLFGSYYNSSSRDVIRIGGEVQDSLSYQNGNAGDYDSSTTSAVLRDTGWYHFVVSADLNQGTQTDRVKIYVNGELQSKSNDAQATRDSLLNWKGAHFIGARSTDGSASAFWDGGMSQVYFIDGQALGPEYFGYTDPLTNVWRPKKFEHLSTAITTQYSGASALTWDDNPIGSVYTLSNGNKTATAGDNSSGYTGADVWSNAIPANATTAFTLEITNSDGVGGWYFTDSQTPSGTHPDERTGNMVGLRNQDADAAFRGTFATANGYSNSGNQLSLLSCHTWGSKRVDFVVYRPASGNGKVWVKNNGSSTWVGGGNPSDTSSTPSFSIPDGDTYFGYTFYDRSNGDQIATLDGDGSIQQKAGPNSFYLPLDGNTPIGKDQSGKGNDWSPVGFGGSVTLDNPTVSGAIPIHNTNDAGTVAKPSGVRTDSKTYTVTASGGKYYLDGVETPTLNAYRGGSYTFDYTGATSHPFYLSSLPDGKHNSKAYSVQFDGSGDYLSATGTGTLAASSDWCMECFFYCTGDSSGTYRIMSANEASQSTEYILMRIRLGQYQFSTDSANSGTIRSAHFNEWTHMALTKSGTTVRGFINGKKIWETTDNNTVTITNLIIGWGYGGEYFPGFISNARFVNGSSVYTADFTPPTTSLTNITNTHLLCCQDNNATTGVISSGSITAAGNAAASQTRQPFLYDNNHGNFGLNLATSNTTKITIPHLAADTLYYYCNAHSGMGSSINVTTDIRKADPYAWKCFLACPYAGDEFDVSDQINCNSTASAATNWNSVQGRNGSTFYSNARYFAAGGGKNINYAGKQEFNFTGDYKAFTIEFFATPSSGSSDGAPISSKGYYSNYGNWYFRFATTNGGRMNFYSYDGQSNGQNNEFQNLGCTDPNRVHHVVVQRDENNLMTFMLDGVIVGQASNVTRALDDGSQSGLTVGRIPSNNTTNSAHNWYLGYITDLRIYSGLAKYSGSVGDHVFTPPSVTPDVLPDTPSGITGKTNLAKITEGAVTGFESNSDYLSIAASNDFVFNGDHTIEMFIYHNSLSDDSVPWSTGGSGAPDQLYINTAGAFYYAYGQTGAINSSNGVIVTGKWQHIAVSKQGTYLRMFVDGKMVAASPDHSSTIGSSSNDARIGNRIDGGNPVRGFISNLRVVQGTALYTSEFTPPTEPLTEVTNTKLLCCQSNTSAGAAAVSPNISGINDGTVWSHYVTGDIDTSFPAWRAFRNDTTSVGCRTQTANGATIVWQPPSPIAFSSSFKIWAARDGTHAGTTFTVTHAGGDTNFTSSVVTSTTQTAVDLAQISGVTSPITKITIVSGGPNPRFSGIEVDTEMLVDPLSPRGNSAATNFNPFTDDINAIRGRESGYATLNPLSKHSGIVLSNGNLTFTNASSQGWRSGGSIGARPSSGKYYFETHLTTALVSNSYNHFVGVLIQDNYELIGGDFGNNANGYLVGTYTGSFRTRNNGSYGPSVTKTTTTGAILQVAIDVDNGKLWFGCDNVWASGSPHLNTSPSYTFTAGTPFSPHFAVYGASASMDVNFGQKPFKFPPPDGYQPLNLSNVQPEKVIARPDQYVKPLIWSGDNTTRKITTGHHPDLVWIKCRSNGAGHRLFDTVRGTIESHRPGGANPVDTANSFGAISAYHNDGFTLTPGSYSGYESGDVNMTGRTYLGWSWKAGGGSGATSGEYWIDDKQYADATAAGLNGGSGITLSGASVGTKQGFSILRYTGGASGSTLSHGLSQAPDFFIIKNHSGDTQGSAGPHWYVKHKSVSGGTTGNDSVFLNLTNGQGNNGPHGICKTSGDSLLEFVDGSTNDVNWHTHDSAATYSCYAWHDIPGLQKFGSYVGNTTDGPFVELGFRPAILWIKCITQTWYFAGFDAARNPYNPNDGRFIAFNNNGTESSGVHNNLDFLSNGFRIRSTSSNSEPTNLNNQTYIYCAWAEAPSVNLYGAQANAF